MANAAQRKTSVLRTVGGSLGRRGTLACPLPTTPGRCRPSPRQPPPTGSADPPSPAPPPCQHRRPGLTAARCDRLRGLQRAQGGRAPRVPRAGRHGARGQAQVPVRPRRAGGLRPRTQPDSLVVRRTTLLPAGLRCHSDGAVWSRYGNACACASENAYTDKTQPTIAQAIAGTVRATVDYK